MLTSFKSFHSEDGTFCAYCEANDVLEILPGCDILVCSDCSQILRQRANNLKHLERISDFNEPERLSILPTSFLKRKELDYLAPSKKIKSSNSSINEPQMRGLYERVTLAINREIQSFIQSPTVAQSSEH